MKPTVGEIMKSNMDNTEMVITGSCLVGGLAIGIWVASNPLNNQIEQYKEIDKNIEDIKELLPGLERAIDLTEPKTYTRQAIQQEISEINSTVTTLTEKKEELNPNLESAAAVVSIFGISALGLFSAITITRIKRNLQAKRQNKIQQTSTSF